MENVGNVENVGNRASNIYFVYLEKFDIISNK